jgi:hypothetical protein
MPRVKPEAPRRERLRPAAPAPPQCTTPVRRRGAMRTARCGPACRVVWEGRG